MKVDTICAIDMGSRNFKFVTGQVVDGQLETKLMGKYEMALGKEVEKNHGVIGPDKLGEIEQVLRRLRDECQAESLKTIRAIATRAIRTAVNGGDVAKLALKLGIDVEIADGIREGEVGYLAATGGDDNRFVAELGSQSFQLAWNTGSGIESSSFPLGYEY
ncbi:MAG: hypothetical protein GY731_06460, partial [Gammaproteobacteria bacterium]|nr:hypothetical protein [Gammaproteobacteria bacterium]